MPLKGSWKISTNKDVRLPLIICATGLRCRDLQPHVLCYYLSHNLCSLMVSGKADVVAASAPWLNIPRMSAAWGRTTNPTCPYRRQVTPKQKYRQFQKTSLWFTGWQQLPPVSGLNVEGEEFQPQAWGVKGLGLNKQASSAKKKKKTQKTNKNEMNVLILIQKLQINLSKLKESRDWAPKEQCS